MADLAFLAVYLAFFALSAGLIAFCERLRNGERR